LIFNEGTQYEGTFFVESGHFDKGKITYTNDDTFEGTFTPGTGVLSFENGDEYCGEVISCVPNIFDK
jgi:hypothetical protein